MKDRIIFFLLGAVLATVAYFSGDMDKADAQRGPKVFEEDVVINGKLVVQGGSILVYDNPNLEKEADELKGMASIDVTDSETNITISSGGIDMDKKSFGSSAKLYARTMPNGQQVSAVSLFGEYSKDQWQLWSVPEATQRFLKQQLDLD